MQEHGQLTSIEADRLRTETDPERREALTRSIRSRHARARLAPGLADGSIDPKAAEALIRRIEAGEHSKQLRAAVATLAAPADGPKDRR
jgi:hypothetical protein